MTNLGNMIITLKSVEHIERTSKSGKPFTSCRLTTYSQKLGKDITLSGFGDAKTKTWNAGDQVDIEVTQNGEYWNFAQNENTKSSPDPVLGLLKEINVKLDLLISKDTRTQVEVQGLSKEPVDPDFEAMFK